jgi:FtsP/CotA-like multicopper oxidase with cupredoxin domain
VVQAQAATVVYNLYATDGYVPLVDGTVAYIYGFIGDRQDGAGFTYQNRCVPYGGDGVNPRTRVCDWPGITSTFGDAAVPTGGPVQPAELPYAGQAQLPAPVIYAGTGDIVEIRMKNLGVAAQPTAPNDPHSIHLHGLDVDAANDGVPETSIGAVPANLCANGLSADTLAGQTCADLGSAPAPGAGNVIVYMFSTEDQGTYMYHCHQEADIHVQMGMYGALVIYKGNEPGATMGPGNPGSLWGFAYDRDYIMLLTEIDLDYHTAEEGTYNPAYSNFHREWNPIDYHPQYWLINGLSFPNTIHASTAPAVGVPGVNWDEWILAHPGYDPFLRGSVNATGPAVGQWGTKGEKVLLRMINLGFETQPMHVHGYHGKVLGSDARQWKWANDPGGKKGPTAFNDGLEKNTFTIGSGETYEILFDLGQQATNAPLYAAGTQSCLSVDGVSPVEPTDPTCSGTPVYWEEDTYILGQTGVTGLFRDNLGGAVPGAAAGQFFPFHNHDDYKATNDGEYPGGAFTMIQALP